MSKRTFHVPDGVWFDETDGLLICCDCGLAHRVEYRLTAGVLQVKLTRDERETKRERRKMKRTPKSASPFEDA